MHVQHILCLEMLCSVDPQCAQSSFIFIFIFNVASVCTLHLSS
uniref:Uncharacterized protein n=1 Tax=Anguilla anguilla TaxID=7936 RepID=A0A0E9S367_ANGAN